MFSRDCKRNFKWPFLQRWQCLIYINLIKNAEDIVFFLNKEVFISLSFSIVFFYKREKPQIIIKQFKTILLIYIMYTWSDKRFNATVVNRALVQRVTWNYTYSPFNFKIGKKLCRPSWVTSLVRQFKLKKVVQQSISTNNIH